MKLRNCFLIAAVGALCASAADRIVGGPYAVIPAARSTTIGWVVQTGEVQVTDGGTSKSVPVLRSEKVSLTGLKPGTTITSEIPGSNGLTGRFKTPAPAGADFQFVVFGDTRTRHELHRSVVAAISKAEPDFVIHTGDLVQDGYDTLQWPNFFDIERDLLRKTVFFPVLGNHERDNIRFHEFFDVKTPYYSFDWGSAHFIILNSDVPNVAISSVARDAFWTEQTRWLEADLEKSQKAEFRFVAMHHPPFTVNTESAGHVSKETPGLVPLFEKYNVTAVFAGHDHNYQHHVKNGIHYVITGGGGAPLAGTGKSIPEMTVKAVSVEHFVQVKVTGKTALVHAIALDGSSIEEIQLGRK
jgi:predicted phosphodiesterase